MFKIENARIALAVKSYGAELVSLWDKRSGREWLWQANPVYWGKSSPVLFPMIGIIKDAAFDHDGKKYFMTKHGFARDHEFYLSGQTPDSLSFTLEDDSKTLSLYPFRFCLQITYRLAGATLEVQYRVINRDKKSMYFSIGGHPAFNCPMETEEWVIEWPNVNKLQAQLLDPDTGLLSQRQKAIALSDGSLKLSAGLFVEDALIFDKLDCREVVLRDLAGENRLAFKFEDFPVFAVWSPPGPFVCLEPWTALPDGAEAPPELRQRPGMIPLGPAESFAAGYQIRLG